MKGLPGRATRDWDAVAAALSDRYRVLALDQRGHGESARPDAYSFELMRDDLARFADALGLDHSAGGAVAYLFAEEWPERVERLVIEDAPPTGAICRRRRRSPPSPCCSIGA